jgi:hypothetical protein
VSTGTSEEWDELERRINLRLPSDYKRFVQLFGRGAIEDETFVINPFDSSVARYHLESEIERERAVYRQAHDQGFLDRHFNERGAYLGDSPRPMGLIPWGGDQSGGTAYWDTSERNPEHWTMYIDNGSEVTRYRENMVTFIVTALQGRPTPLFWPEWRCPARYVRWVPPRRSPT